MSKPPTSVMIIGVNDDQVEFFEQVLEGAGFLVTSEKTLERGLKRAFQNAPHLFILDVVNLRKTAEKFFTIRKDTPALMMLPVLATGAQLSDELAQEAKSWGAAETLKTPSDSRTLLQKVNRLARSRQILRHEFSSTQLPPVEVRTHGQIIMANEAGFLLEAPVRLSPRAQIDIQSPLLEKLACSQAVFRRTPLVARSVTSGLFLNEIAAVGLSPATLGRIRQTVRNWK